MSNAAFGKTPTATRDAKMLIKAWQSVRLCHMQRDGVWFLTGAVENLIMLMGSILGVNVEALSDVSSHNNEVRSTAVDRVMKSVQNPSSKPTRRRRK